MRTRCLLLVLFSVAANLLGQDIIPPTISRITPTAGSTVVQLNQLEVMFSEEVQGVDAADLLINGTPATGLIPSVPGQYRFTFAQPLAGTVQVEFAAGHGITDLAAVPNAFAGESWTYTLNPALALFQVRINEFMANNQTGIRDEDGTYQDWIELYNPGITPVSLAGCYLTDNKSDLKKWRFPSNSPPVLSPNTYLIVWASNKDRTNAAGPLHTNFRLDPNPGEYLALVDFTGTNVISAFDPAFPKQEADISYGRDAADPSLVGYYSKPTPGAANTSSGDGFAAPVLFSREGGTFSTPFSLSLSTPSTTATIYYTLVTNGTATGSGNNTITNVPTTNSPLYTGPLLINQTTQVRVRAFEPGKLPSEPVSVTYIQISNDVAAFSSDLPIVVVLNFNGGVLQGVQTDKTAEIASFHADLDRSSLTNKPTLMTRGAANDRGSSTAGQPKVNMAVEFWDEFNQDTDHPLLNMPAESDWVFYGINAFDQSMMHNAIFHWFGNAVGRYSSRTRYAEVFLKTTTGPVTMADYNGVYLVMEKPKRNKNRVDIESLQPENTNAPSVTGGYILRIDRVDADERTFTVPTITTTSSNVYANTYGGQGVIVDYPNSIQWATDPRRAPQRLYITDYFTNFIKALTSTNFTDPVRGYAAYIDVDSWVKDNIHNALIFNADAWRLSGYFFKDRDKKVEQGPPWDCDRCAGAGGPPNNDNRPFHPRVFRIPTTSVSQDNGTDFFGRSDVGVDWWDRLFRDPDFWQKWIDRYQQFRTNEFLNEKIVAMVDGFYAEIKEAQVRDQARWPSFTYPRTGVVTAGPYTAAGVTTPAYSYDFGPRNTAFTSGGYFTNEVAFQKKWLFDRLEFFDTNFLAMPQITVGTSPVTNGTTITVQAAFKPNTVILYTLDGTDPRLPGGSVSPLAQTNLGNLTLTISNNVQLFARCYNTNHFNLTNISTSPTVFEVGKPHSNSFWSGPISATYYTAVPPLRITEIMYHPADPPPGVATNDEHFEYIEVKNISAAPLNVKGFRIRGGLDFDFPSNTLAAGESAVVVRDAAVFQSRYGAGPRILGVYTNDNLGNDGDHLVLEGSLREPILDFDYHDDWYPSTDGHGFSLQIVNDGAATDTWGLKSSWRPSGVAGGTPSTADPGPAQIATIYVNEALTKTDPVPGDAIELYNPTGNDVNIGGWFLTDDLATPEKYRILDGTSIPANGYIVFYQSNSFGTGPNAFALSSFGDEVYVFSADVGGHLTGWAHGYSFGPQANGVTFGRHITSLGEDRFVTQSAPTLGAANSGPKVGPIVISEINYHPPDFRGPHSPVDNNRDEYIELQNTSGANVPLYDTNNPANTWQLRDAVDFTFPVGTTVPAGAFILVVGFNPSDSAQLAKFREVNGVPLDTPIYGPWNGQLDNSQDSVELVRPDLPVPPGTPSAGFVAYLLVDKVNYQDTFPWPVGLPDGLGAVLGRVDVSAYGDDPANWRTAPKTPGTPLPAGGTPPFIVTQPVSTSGVEGQSATFTLTATGSALGYIWTRNGEVFSAPSSPVLTLTGLNKEKHAGSYACYVFNSAGSVLSSNATLVVLLLPTIAQQPFDQRVYEGSNATFSVSVRSDVPLTLHYQWRKNGTPIPNATSSSLTLTNIISEVDDGLYSVVVTDNLGTVTSVDARLTVLLAPVLINPVPRLNLTAVPGENLTLGAQLRGTKPIFVQWRKFNPIGGSQGIIRTNSINGNQDFLAILNVSTNAGATTNSAGIFTIQFTNTAGGSLSTTSTNHVAVLTVLLDSNNNGIPDTWESQYFGSPTGADRNADSDGDGMSNWAEYTAGTDPTNAASYLKVDSITVPGSALITFQAVAGHTYTVEYTDDLTNPVWARLADVTSRTVGSPVTVTDPTPQPDRYYRLVTPRRP